MMRSTLFPEVLSLQNTLERAVNEMLGGGPFQTLWSREGNGGTGVAQAMPFDVYATDTQAVVMAAVPGMNPDDLEVTVHQNTISLSGRIGNIAETDETKDATWYVHELPSGTFRRSITLPFQIDADHVQASFENGVVRVIAPKAEQARPRRISIVSGQIQQPDALGAGNAGEQQS